MPLLLGAFLYLNRSDMSSKNKEALQYIYFDREKITPCNKCRKRTSCQMKPREGKCNGLELGEPWKVPDYSTQIDQLED